MLYRVSCVIHFYQSEFSTDSGIVDNSGPVSASNG